MIDPYQVVHEFSATMPERLAAAKLRGFVEDYGGEVLASEPGLIRMRLGVPEGYTGKKPGGSALFSWFRKGKPPVPQGLEPIQLELHMEKPDPSLPARRDRRVPATKGLSTRECVAGRIGATNSTPSSGDTLGAQFTVATR